MNVYLIRTGTVDDDLYTGVYEFLKHKTGPYNFNIADMPFEITVSDEIKILEGGSDDFHTKKMPVELCKSEYSTYNRKIRDVVQYSWADLLLPCKNYRLQNRLEKSDVIINLTSHGNHHNWFTGFEQSGEFNFFVCTEMWNYYTDGDCRYPIAYLISTILFKKHMFISPLDAVKAMHKVSRGCIMDFCEQKQEIALKMRTADVCTSCQDKIKKNAVPLPILRYTFELLEEIRKQLLAKERYGMLTPKGTLLIKGYQKHIIIPEMGMLKINLTPLERAVYLLFLNHAEGIRLSEMHKYKAELTDLVKSLSRSDNPADISYSIDALCMPDSNSLSEKLARIRNKFNKHLGEEMAAQYIVSGPNGGLKKINLDREHLSLTA
jgi:hypothetical protein